MNHKMTILQKKKKRQKQNDIYSFKLKDYIIQQR